MENMKKSTTMCGTLMAPLCVGRRALILYNGGYVHTSTVVAIQSVDAREIRFETRNTHYRLLPAPVAQEADFHPALMAA
jgi:hypothetical protein